MVIRSAIRILFWCVVMYSLVAAGSSILWWAFDSGPMSVHPESIFDDAPPGDALRVYGDYPDLDMQAAADRTVDALEVAGGFDRAVLVVTVPTGSGWVDPDQIRATERWADGNIATVAMRYASAPSAAAYMLRPDLATESARALLTEVTERIRARTPGDRPGLVVHGLSLGAYAGDAVLDDPALAELVDSALWQGRPGADSGAAPSISDPCIVSAVNADDPVSALSWGLLREPGRAAAVVAALPGSASTPAGSGHRYRPVLPPPGCVNPQT